jgi:hypothetical protein
MNKNSAPRTTKLSQGGSATKDIKLSLFTAAVSATLRMAVPTIGLFLVGLTIDFMLQQPAFYAIVGAGVGFLIAVVLIYFQVKKLQSKGHDALINDPNGIVKPKPAKKNTREKK